MVLQSLCWLFSTVHLVVESSVGVLCSILQGVTAWHGIHFPTILFTWVSIPGNQTCALKICFVRAVPWCPSWAISTVLSLSDIGITIISPRRTIPSTLVSSVNISLLRLRTTSLWLIFPCFVHSIIFCQTLSLSVLSVISDLLMECYSLW